MAVLPALSGEGIACPAMAAAGEETAADDDAAMESTPVRRVDPLALLRECTTTRQKVEYRDEYLQLGSYRIHKHTKCGFRLSPSEPFLDIGSVWYMSKEISGDRSYTKESASKRGFTYIGVASRGDLCDYLDGKVSTCPGLVKEVVEGLKRPREESQGLTPKAPRQKKSREQPDLAGEGDGAPASPSAASRPKKGQLCYADVAQRVRPVKELDMLVRIPGRTVPHADLILKIARDEVANWHRPAPERPQREEVLPLYEELENMLKADPQNLPIILVPCNKNAPVNLLNAGKLLQDGEWYRPDRERVVFFESSRTQSVEVCRNIRGKQWTFQVRDTTKGFSKKDWLRVVCVITDGNDWQFKGWPFETIVDMFTTVKGIYFQAVDKYNQIPIHVREWPSTILKMERTQFQHRFGAVRDSFWSQVESFLMAQRMKKFVNHTTLEGVRKEIRMTKPVL